MTALESLPPRKAIPKAWKLAAWERDGGKCCECGTDVPQTGPGVEYDHRLALWLHGAHSIANIAPICPEPCHKTKTRREAPIRAKVNRIRKDRAGLRKARKAIPSRPFNSKGKAPLGRLKREALREGRETARPNKIKEAQDNG